ncbi:membrane protein insertase YidC [Nocardia puris]|uniref:Membrane protein insertase YidC n=1 Tax=Nocardia puris TaxID=208602 RepID=A0A366DW66_9NOCA|nr:membrane protein insertase YidC [Nocardia puris]RBO94323.1 YidC/Oxa1 family membrane protein insertase [Nocardia puris]
MLDIVYYPVSAVLKAWHSLFALAFGPASAVAWVLAIVFLVITFRAALIPVALRQTRTQAAMLRLRPRVDALKAKYPDDPRTLATETQALYREQGVRPLAGCLPLLGQALVFFGLFHVLRSFDRTHAVGQLPFQATAAPMSAEQNARTPNYLFEADGVRAFLDAHVFGAPLSATLAGQPTVPMMLVAGALVLAAAVATHFTARGAAARQTAAQPALLTTLTLWVFPAGLLIGGPLLPVAILVYWVANNGWTLGQQYLVHRRVDAETAVAAPVSASRATAPKPGAKPVRGQRTQTTRRARK